MKDFKNQLEEKYQVICWLIDSHRYTGLKISDAKFISREWIVERYNSEIKHFEKYKL